MTTRLAAAILAGCVAPAVAASQSVAARPAAGPAVVHQARDPTRKQMHAVRVDGRAPRIDGRLDDPIWRLARFAADFVQKEPDEGASPQSRTEIAFSYDENALYVGARMSKGPAATVRAPLTRRDNGGDADRILVSLDTYLDRRTAYTFGVTAAGVRLDHYHPEDDEGSRDESFDPVWEATVARDSAGWTAEMRIPFAQLRFSKRDAQTWGVNVRREVPALNEDNYWVLVPRKGTGWASRFGDLVGVAGIAPSRRVELLPYAASGATLSGARDFRDPFDDGTNLESRVGGDLKMGFGPNLTLQATVNPDFGQVEADPAVVNLTAYEVFFEERRPFFTEGRDLLEAEGLGYFYSRRIGAPPHGRASGDYTRRPDNATILGAAKLTGRLPSGLSVGALVAVTDREFATVVDTARVDVDDGDTTVVPASWGRLRIEPRTGYAVTRLQQELGRSSSTAGLTLTALERSLRPGEPLSERLTRRAVSGGGDWKLRFKGGEYEVEGHAGFSHVAGDPAAILGLQQSSARYFQRPDADYVEVDSARRSLSGYTAALQVQRRGGEHWLWEVGATAESPGLELNDVGQLSSTDDIGANAAIRYRETDPGRLFRRYQIELGLENSWNFGWVRQSTVLGLEAGATWRNYWETSLSVEFDARALSDALTRGGPLMGAGAGWEAQAEFSTNSRAPTVWEGELAYGRDELGGWRFGLEGQISVRPTDQWELSINPEYEREVDSRQFIEGERGGPVATFGRRYIFSFVDVTEISTTVRLSYTFSPTLSLEMHARPHAASGRFYDFGELVGARSRALRRYGTDGSTIVRNEEGEWEVTDGSQSFELDNEDFHERSFRSNIVLRWEWRLGSTLFLIWGQDRELERERWARVRPNELWRALGTRGEHVLAVKASYWLPLR